MVEYKKIREVVEQAGIGSFVCKGADEVISKKLPVGLLLSIDDDDAVVFDLVGCVDRGNQIIMGYWVTNKGDKYCTFKDEEDLDILLDKLVMMFTLKDDKVRETYCKKVNRCKLMFK